jgi:4a-hydroxytetrahydrobiopterin dehydratase
MNDLKDIKCEPCTGSTQPVPNEEISQLLQKIPEWELVEIEGINQLTRSFMFKNFIDALEFTNKVGAIAEAENHHPEIITEWGKVTVTWWTHKIKGLHLNDFIMAAKTDDLLNEM